jgi:prepilin-type N-terminal cleavage/methylation domain-containing protein
MKPCVRHHVFYRPAYQLPKPTRSQAFLAGFTLVELLVTLTIIAILGSLTLAGLAVARQRVKAARTESTIRKIHEVVMPHFERLMTRSVPQLTAFAEPANTTANTIRDKCMGLVAKRRILALELPDGWNDFRADRETVPFSNPLSAALDTPISLRMKQIAEVPPADLSNSDAECLWASVMQGGFADPAIVAHFREDEFADRNQNGRFEFIDGWSNPIRFLRWAPAFISKYQPLPTNAPNSTETSAHDSFDLAGLDPLARNTLFPLIFSGGPDGIPAIRYRQNEGDSPAFGYARVKYDPYFAGSGSYPTSFPEQARPQRKWPGSQFKIFVNGTEFFSGAPAWTYSLDDVPAAYKQAGSAFGAEIPGNEKDDITNHSMSR